MADSQQKKVGRVRPPRVQITYDVETGGAMKKVQVKFAGKRARTDGRGKAIICKRFKDSGVRHPRLRKRGHERAKLRVNVRP